MSFSPLLLTFLLLGSSVASSFRKVPLLPPPPPYCTMADVLPLVLRKDDHLTLAEYDEKAATLVEVAEAGARCTGDYRECEVAFHPTTPSIFAHATTTHVRIHEVISRDAGHYGMRLLCELEVPHVTVQLAFSARGTYLLAYAMMDPKRTPNGNLLVIDVERGRVVQQCMQARWPAMVWTADESFCVRVVNGCLHVLGGALTPKEGGALCKMDLMLGQDKDVEFCASPSEALPAIALFKPFAKQTPASLLISRLPNIREPMYQANFGRSEAASLCWSPSGQFLAVTVKSERDPSGKSYYGTMHLHIVDVLNRSMVDVKLKGEGETVHDCQWSPATDELLVVHGKMPHNKATLFSKKGVALLTFGEAPRNMSTWAPNGKALAMGGSGNLAGDYHFYSIESAPARPGAAAAPPPSYTSALTGHVNEKCSFSTWAPDSHNFLCATCFTRLRTDNKVMFVKNNGQRVLTQKYPMLYGA
ncbi:translation initiation factor 2A, partial [Strigomonas culicis]